GWGGGGGGGGGGEGGEGGGWTNCLVAMGLGGHSPRHRIHGGGRGPGRPWSSPFPPPDTHEGVSAGLHALLRAPSRGARSGGQTRVLVDQSVHPCAADHWTADNRGVCGGGPRRPQPPGGAGAGPLVTDPRTDPEPPPD